MRIADNMNYMQANRNIQKNRLEAAELQNQAATQKRINKPSDDPIGAARVLSARTDIQHFDQYKKNLNVARNFLEYTDQALGEVTDILSRAKEMAIGQANSAGANAVTRATAAVEIDQMHKNIIQIGNRKLGERYLFGGYQTTHSPFEFNGNYHGDNGEMMVEINKGTFLAMNLPGDKVFLGHDSYRSGDQDSINSPQSLEDLKKLATLREGGPSGEAEEGAAVPKSATPQNQQGPQIRGPASVENSTKPATEASSTPTSMAEYDNQPVNVLNIMKGLETALRANDPAGIRDHLQDLDSAINQVVILRANIGARSNTIDKTLEALQRGSQDSRALASSYEDADAYQVFSDITRNEGVLKATLNTSSKLIQTSLLDFLR